MGQWLYLAFLCNVWMIISPVNSQNCGDAVIRGGLRVDCGFPGISKAACEARRCCWDRSIFGANWCFYELTAEVCSSMNADERYDCGSPGMSGKACLDRGCCWDTTGYAGVRTPWCFYTETIGRLMSWGKRVNCGTPEISREECKSKGCIFDSSYGGVPWCFYYQPRACPMKSTNEISPTQRVNCGTPGMSGKQCLDRNCCWDRSLYGVPWCFNP